MGQKRPEGWVDPRRESGLRRTLELLRKGEYTLNEISEKISVSRPAAQNYVKVLMAEPRQIRICGWRHTKGKEMRVFGIGAEPDAPFVTYRAMKKRKVDVAALNLDSIVSALAMPQTAAELAEKLRVSETFVHTYLPLLLKENPRRIYIYEWRRHDGPGPLVRVFAAGKKKDKTRPMMTKAERFQELKADPQKHARSLLLRRLAAARRKKRGKPVSPFAALGL